MGARGPRAGRGTLIYGHAPRTFSLRPPSGLALAGLWLVLCSWGAGTLDPGVVKWAGLMLCLPVGVTCLVMAFALRMRYVRLRREIERAGPAPWEAEGLWNAAGATLALPVAESGGGDGPESQAARSAMGAAALVAVNVVPAFAWRCAIIAAQLLGDRLVRPRTPVAARVAFAEFPSFRGRRARFTVTLARRAPAEPFDTVAVTLRCVRETRRLGGWFRPEARCAAEIPGVAVSPATPGDGPHEFVFDVPAESPGTDLLAQPAVYWELVIRAAAPSRRYEQAFHVPVYAAAPAPVTT